MAYGLARIALEGMAEEAALYLAHPELQLPHRRRRLSQARQAARGWSETLPAERRRSLAALFVQACLTAYAAKAAPGLTLGAPFEPTKGRFSLATQALADEVARQAADLPVDEALHGLTGLYSALLDSRERSERGAFYTPPVLAERLLDLAGEQGLDWKTARVLDPASGGGAFLIPAARRMRAALVGADPAFVLAQIGARLQGLEMDAHAAWIGQAALEIALADLVQEARRPVPVVVTVGDSLEAEPSESFDLVIGNPPYGRVALTDEQRVRYGRSLYGHANLYGVFTDLALRWTRPGGLIAYLTPTSFLGGRYYAALRRLLSEEAPPAAIDFVHDRSGVFEDVLQETCLTVYRKGALPARAQVHYVTLDDEGAAKIERNGTIALPAGPEDPWLAPRAPAQSRLIAAAGDMAWRLSDWGYGVSTGPLVWNRFKPQLTERSGRDVYPLIWAECVTADGRFIHRAQRRNHAPWFRLERGDEWLRTDQACVLVQRTTAKEQARRLIATEMPAEFIAKHGGVVVENHLNMVRPIGRILVSPAAVAAFLNSQVADQLFRCISGSVAVSAFELEALPLPSPAAMRAIEVLLAEGASAQVIDAALARLYRPAKTA